MNYSQLSTAIQDYAQNSETTFLAHLNDFIIAAEDKIFFAIDAPAFWKADSTQVTASGTAEYTLPAGVLDIDSVRIGETAVGDAEEVVDGPVRYLLRKDYSFLLEAYPGTDSAQATGTPEHYAVSSAGVTTPNPNLTIRLGPAPDAIYPITVDYYGKTAADSITNGSTPSAPLTTETWISVTAPDALLYGALTQGAAFTKDPELLQVYEAKFSESLMMLKNLCEGRQVSDSYMTGQKTVSVQ